MIPCDAYAKQLQSDHAVLLDMYVFRPGGGGGGRYVPHVWV